MIDFNKLSRPKSGSASIDPIEIFAKTPNLKDAPNDLWKGQADALKLWHENRKRDDNAILLNTGAGKSIVGVLIAQSLVNENIGPIVFVCSTIDLVIQTSKECDKLGIKYTTRTHGDFSNDLFQTGKAFCITTYQAVFTANTTFSNDKAPAGIIFDDAHVAERAIRDSFTLSIPKANFPKLFDDLISIVRPEFQKISKEPHLNYILEMVGGQQITMCPPTTAFYCSNQILEALKSVDNWRKSELFFAIIRLWEGLSKCAIFISANTIEITPPFIPTGVYDFLSKGTRRVSLSATLDFETDFIRGFGQKNAAKIAPDNDAGNGERLILLSSRFKNKTEKVPLATHIIRDSKLLISVPSYPKAAAWTSIGAPPNRNQFTSELNAFRAASKGHFILVSRIDGIDLPQDSCRIMLIDGAPSGASLIDHFLFQHLSLSNLYSTKMASRITQLLGRINRGRSDFGAFIIYGSDINVWLKTERNLALLPELIRKQVILRQTVQDGMGSGDINEINSVIAQVIARDQGWLDFYRDTVDGLEVSQDALEKVKLREEQLAISALAECKFMTMSWQGNDEGARTSLLDVLDSTAIVDAKLAGWYSVWIGASFEAAGDMETAISHYKKARSRLSAWLNVPFTSVTDLTAEKDGIKNETQKVLLGVNNHGPQAIGDYAAKLKIQARKLLDPIESSNSKEEAVRQFGELLGFDASRPDCDTGSGPDVIWKDAISKSGIAFELKTQKNEPAEYNKHEIGQSFNHVQWLSDNEKEYKWNGVLIVGPIGKCKPEGNPSDYLYFVETKILAARFNEFASKIADTRSKIALERWSLLAEIGGLFEWQIEGWFGTLAKTLMRDLK